MRMVVVKECIVRKRKGREGGPGGKDEACSFY
jgi:hypothetical protein